MKELPIIIREELRNGLRPQATARAAINSPFLLDMQHIRLDDLGPEPVVLPQDPFNKIVPVDWPFPQIFRGQDVTLLCARRSVKEVTEALNMWATTSLTLYDTSSPTATKQVTEGGVWHHADLGNAWYLTNGESVIFKTGLGTIQDQVEKVWCNTSITIKTLCHHRGRMILGGLGSDIWSGSMNDIFREVVSSVEEDFALSYSDIDSNYVLWSSVGADDFPLWLFTPLNYPIDFHPTWDKFFSRMKRGQIGWAPCTFQGSVLSVVPMGDPTTSRLFIAFGEDGVTAFRHVPAAGDVPDTYGTLDLGLHGAYDRGSALATRNSIVFMDREGVLWRISESLELTRLGYEEYLREFIDNGETVVMTFDPLREDIYICSEERGFLLTSQGASRIHFSFPNRTAWRGKTYAMEKSGGSLDGKYALIETNNFDVEDRSQKTITNLHVGHRGGGTVEASLKYKLTTTGEFEQTEWVPLNHEGNVALRVTALEHRVLVRASDPTDFELDFIRAGKQTGDRRFQRGPRDGTRVAKDVG